jgi:hypothetical protein
MIGHLSNKNENATISKSKKFCELNKAKGIVGWAFLDQARN